MSAKAQFENSSLDEIRAYFACDLFASQACGCTIQEASHGHAVCAVELRDVHRNAQGAVMGGAIFTLADFALAVACNVGELPTVAVTNTIEFIGLARGSKLVATCDADKSGRSMGFYRVQVTDDLGNLVAKMSATCYRRT